MIPNLDDIFDRRIWDEMQINYISEYKNDYM